MKIAVLPGDGIGPEIVAQAVQGAATRSSLTLETARGAGRRRRLRGARRSAARSDARAREGRPTRCCSARSATRSTTRWSAPCARSRRSSACARSSACSPTCARRICYPELAARLGAEARGGRGPRHPDRARAHRRHLLRPAARHRRATRPASAKASTRCATREPRDRRIARVGFEAARKRGKRAVLGRQGQRARDLQLWRDVVDRGRAGLSGRRADAHVRRQRGDAAGARRRSSST